MLGRVWEDTYAEALVPLGFVRGKASPCCFFHRARGISIVVHGDDFSSPGMRSDLAWIKQRLAEKFEIGGQTILGTEKQDSQQARILNQILTVTTTGLQYEADPRHVEHLTSALRLQECSFADVPGIKQRDIMSEEEC